MKRSDSRPKRGNKEESSANNLHSIAPITPTFFKTSTDTAILHLVDLSDELLAQIVQNLSEKDCLSFSLTCHKMQNLVIFVCDRHWSYMYNIKYNSGIINSGGVEKSIIDHAVEICGNSWFKLFSCKSSACKDISYEKACDKEIEACVLHMLSSAAAAYEAKTDAFSLPSHLPPLSSSLPSTSTSSTVLMPNNQHHPKDVAFIFLVDGSGSVEESDFTHMTDFMHCIASYLAAEDPSSTRIKMGIIQFSTTLQIELDLTDVQNIIEKEEEHGDEKGKKSVLKKSSSNGKKSNKKKQQQEGKNEKTSAMTNLMIIQNAISAMHRMNGATDIALAILRAGQMFEEQGAAGSAKVIALITDGQIDAYQSINAADILMSLADEHYGLSVYAFGFGRGVDKYELLRIIEAAVGGDQEKAKKRYLPIMVSAC